MANIAVAIFVIFVIGPLNAAVVGRPSYIQCQSNAECSPGYCCTITPGRYTTPQCQPFREQGEMCRPHSTTVNSTLIYPDGARVDLKNVYYVLCPCTYGLSCDTKDGTCRDLSQKSGFNHLQGEVSTED